MSEDSYTKVKSQFISLCADYSLRRTPHDGAGDEFDQLLASGRFQQIAVHDGALLARTRMVYMKPLTENWRRIGEYLLEINKNNFRALNLVTTIGGHNGPHLNKEGLFCISQGKEEIMMYIKEGKLAQTLFAVEQLLWHLNPDQKGQFVDAKVEQWPLANEGELEWLKQDAAVSSDLGRPAATSRSYWQGWGRRS